MTRVLVIGSGLIGTSIGMSLSAAGHEVLLDDIDAESLALSVSRGAGRRFEPGSPEPEAVFVAVPPRQVARVVVAALAAWQRAAVTDVASVKGAIVAKVLEQAGRSAARYVGGHPMAGREVSGPAAAASDLFRDRPWVVTPGAQADAGSVELVLDLIAATGAVPVELLPEEHDRAVALTSHTPQVLASLLAGRLAHARPEHVLVSGQGLRDTVRIAGSDPALWTEILTANAEAVLDQLRCLAGDLGRLIDSLESGGDQAREAVHAAIARGRRGVARLPGKHGAGPVGYRSVRVAVPDEPGALARLFADASEAGVNLEDVRIEHALGRPTGLVELSVAPGAAERLAAVLGGAGWALRP